MIEQLDQTFLYPIPQSRLGQMIFQKPDQDFCLSEMPNNMYSREKYNQHKKNY